MSLEYSRPANPARAYQVFRKGPARPVGGSGTSRKPRNPLSPPWRCPNRRPAGLDLLPACQTEEMVHHDLAIWGVPSEYLPEVEFGFEDALPDPDTTAERPPFCTNSAPSRSQARSG